MKNPIIYILINGQLGMSPGKAAAQAVHAAMMLEERGLHFTKSFKRTVIVLEAKDAETLKSLQEYLNIADIWSDYYIDEGINEVSPFSITALVVEPIDSEDSEKREIFSPFNLFGSNDYDDDYDDSFSGEAVVNELRRIANVLTPQPPQAKLKKLSLWQRWKNRKYQSRVS